jgi:hypothetical protein
MEDAGGLNSRGFSINSMNIVVADAFFPGPNRKAAVTPPFSRAVSRWSSGS